MQNSPYDIYQYFFNQLDLFNNETCKKNSIATKSDFISLQLDFFEHIDEISFQEAIEILDKIKLVSKKIYKETCQY